MQMLPITRATAQNICRICLQEFKSSDNTTHLILNKNGELEKWLRSTISNARLRMEIEQLEYPNRLCQSCFMKTDIFYKFRERIYCGTEVLKELCSENLPTQIYENLQQFCRMCLVKRERPRRSAAAAAAAAAVASAAVKPDAPFDLEQTPKLRSWLEECGGIEMEEVLLPLFPKFICHRCHKKLNNFIAYRDLAQQSTQYLQSVLECREDDDDDDDDDAADALSDSFTMPNLHSELRSTTPIKIEVTPNVVKLEQLSDDEDEKNIDDSIFVEHLPEIKDEESMDNILDDNGKNIAEILFVDRQLTDSDNTREPVNLKQVENPLANCDGANTISSEAAPIRRPRGRPRKLPTIQEPVKRIGAKYKRAAAKIRSYKDDDDEDDDDNGHNGDDKSANNDSSNSSAEHKGSSKHGKKYSDHKHNIYCQHCPRKFRKKVLFDAHMRQNHSQLEKPFTCAQCNKSYRLYSSMLRHIKETHTENADGQQNNEVHYCEFCCKPFKRKNHLNAHVLTVHEKRRPYKCSYCDKSFGAPKTRRVHEMSHTGEYPYSCEFCSKRFRQITYLNAHKEQHTTNPALLCPICKRAKANEEELREHIERHKNTTVKKSFQCPKCGKILTSAKHLREHENAVHLKLRPFKCRFCDATFAIRQTCQSHEFIHTGERPLVCAICGMSFRHRNTLYLHLRKRHPEEIQNPENTTFINLKKQDFQQQQRQQENAKQLCMALVRQEINKDAAAVKDETTPVFPTPSGWST